MVQDRRDAKAVTIKVPEEVKTNAKEVKIIGTRS